MRHLLGLVLLVIAPLAAAASPCAGTVAQARALLGNPPFALAWEETTMTDGRPLLVTIEEREAGLFIVFQKTGEGLWAEGSVRLCRTTDGFEARFAADNVRTGPAANWLIRQALEGGTAISLQRISESELRLATMGWSGRFTPGSGGTGIRRR